MVMLPFLVWVVVAATATPDARGWVEANRPTVLTWNSFDPELVKAVRGKAESIGVVYGHFQSQKGTDAALLSQQNGHLVFEIVHCAESCAVESRRDLNDGAEGIRFASDQITYLTLVPKGRTAGTSRAVEDEHKSVRLVHDAVQLVTFEKTAVVWYWNTESRQWDSVSTAD
jgi:hypothetical protein